jgi:hypothetical protein
MAVGWTRPCAAGPPYVTDDPEPTDTGHWEDRVFVLGGHTPGDTQGQAGFDINYGAAKDLQLTIFAPLDYDSAAGNRAEPGDLQLSAKYRFLHQGDHDPIPDVSLFPAVSLPTAGRAFDPGRVSLFLPIWVQKDFGPWSTFGGGGWDINPGPGHRDYALLGWAVTRKVTKRLNLGVEVYHQTAGAVGARPFTAVAPGAILQLTSHWAVMASAGPGVQNTRQQGQLVFYSALQLTY